MGHHLGAAALTAKLVLLFPGFLAAALARQGFLYALLLTRLEVKGVTLDLLDDVFLLHFALETAQSILEGFALLESDFSQRTKHPQTRPNWTAYLLQGSVCKSSDM